MNNKILVEVFLPSVNKSYDVYIPVDVAFYEVEMLLAGAFADIPDIYFSANREIVICDRVTGEVLDINMTAFELGLMNGSKLMLI